jgi:hypothetical protein
MTRRQRWFFGFIAAIFLLLAMTNPDTDKLRSQLVAVLRDRVDSLMQGSDESARLLGALISSYAPETVEGMVDITRKNYLFFSHFIVKPKGLLSVSLELAEQRSLSREGLCVIGIVETFFPCNSNASKWLSGAGASR